MSMVILVGFGVLIFGKNWGFFDSVSSRCGNALVLKKELVSRKESGSKTECWKLPGLYFGVVMCLGILYMLVLAPLSAPDEVSHYISAYELSNRFLGLPGTDEDGYIYIRAEDDWICLLYTSIKPVVACLCYRCPHIQQMPYSQKKHGERP